MADETRAARMRARADQARRCGAKARTGAPRKMRPASPAAKRRRLHGGLSSGPKTEEGRERIAAAQRARWARRRNPKITARS